jgi:hypothetical protein
VPVKLLPEASLGILGALPYGLLNCAADIREHIACVRTHETNRSDRNCQNDCEHDRVLGNILGFVWFPQLTKKASHLCAPRFGYVIHFTQNEPSEGARQWPVGVVDLTGVTFSDDESYQTTWRKAAKRLHERR